MNSIPLFVESLEPRVAPAILVNGGNLLGGTGNPTTGETSSGGNTVQLIKVITGEALVFYDASSSTITGISVGKHTKLDITGNIPGDIVTNLLPDGRLTDSDHNPANGEDGGILLPFGIKGITTHALGPQNGDLGRIISGGAVNNVNIAGSLSGIYAGDGIFRDGPTAVVDVGNVDVNTIVPGLQHTFVLTQADALSGSKANINNVVVRTANHLEIFAGGGSNNTDTTGGVGGVISNVTITKTLAGQGNKPALFLHAGDGGSGTDGGAGGSIINFDDQNSTAYVKIQTGDGGAASTGVGGVGGSFADSTIKTSSPRYDVFMGTGGSGVSGGKGGSISELNFTNNIIGGRSLIAAGDFNNDGIQDILLVNTITGEATLSLGTAKADTPFVVALQPLTNPDGSTSATAFIAAEGAVPSGLIATDLNGDGSLDFVVSYSSTNDLGVFLNRGNGTFIDSAVALPASPTSIALGHFTGTAAPSIAVLSGGNVASINGGANSQVFIAQDDGAGNFSVLANPVTVTGVGTDIAAAQIDGVGGTDAFVGLKSGQVTPLFSTGSSFTVQAPISVFMGVPVDNLDVSNIAGSVTLLAFSKNINANDPTMTGIAAEVELIAVQADGTGNISQSLAVDPTAQRAHFVAGTGVIGVVAPASLALFENGETGYAAVANLASDGALSDFSGSVTNGSFHIAAVGAATNRFFYTDGPLDSTAGLPALKHFNLPYEDRVISFLAGNGGIGGALRGGNGGSVGELVYTQTLGGGVIEAGGAYNTFVTTGDGGASGGGTGGRGGDMTSVSLSLNPGYLNDGQDDTDFALLRTGVGGAGAGGGKGGDITKATSNSIFSDVTDSNVDLGSVAVQLEAGNGGAGTAKAGGVGGSVKLAGQTAMSGVTFYDSDSNTPDAPALFAEAGSGGAGVTKGGAGGALVNIGAQNATTQGDAVNRNELGSAYLLAGAGGNASQGDGGVGGDITGADVAVQKYGFDGWITVAAGAGGNSTNGHGGMGGTVVKSTAASSDGDTNLGFGVLVTGGAGGDGTAGGGMGGGIKKLTVNTPSESNVSAGVVAAGNGGNATLAGAGGAGGNIKGVIQTKDVNSAITAILGGSGGTGIGSAGGAGGSVKNIDTVGFVGLPADNADLGVFDAGIASPTIQGFFADGTVAQGIFAGRGFDGAANGSVHNVVARQIAAIGAVVNEQGLFGVAAAVTKVNADLIGYEVTRDNTFQSTAAGGVSPASAVPVDGFILAASVSGITTIDETRTASFTFNG